MEGQLGKSTSMAQLTHLLLAEWSHRAEPGHGAPGLPGQILYLTFFFKDFIYLFLERGREGESCLLYTSDAADEHRDV